jgi:GntR family transcriptional repressor for pyruvate dehydrogenase complex
MTNELFTTLGDITKKSMSNILLEKFIELIMEGKLKPGFTFPNENDMCKRIGVGRSTLRETYTALKAMGFITRTKAGTTVNNNRQIISSVPLNFMFRNSDLKDIYEFRNMLETQCAQIASLRASQESINRMGEIIELMRLKAAENDIKSLTELDVKFHFEIASSVGNPLIKNTLFAVTNEFEQSAYAGYRYDQSVIEQSIDFHQQIFEAIKNHDPELARFKMQAHINNIYYVLQKVFSETV